MKVPFAKPHFSEFDVEWILDEARKVLQSGWLTSGKNVEEFERQFAEIIGTKYAVAVNSCTAALHTIAIALDLKQGDEVIVPADTFVATANMARYVGAKPVFADSDRETFNISPGDVQKKITRHTRAIVPVHLGGNPCDMKELLEIAEDNRVPVIEDAAHAHGATYQGKACGSLGLASAFSFYSTKVMTSGEGGMITTDDQKVADRAKRIRNGGRGGFGPLEITELGHNFRLPDIQGVIGLSQLRHLAQFLDKRRRVAMEYDKLLSRIEVAKPQVVRHGNRSSYYSYIVKLTSRAPISRDALMKRLGEKGIGTSILYHPVVTQPLYAKDFDETASVPVALDLGRNSFALPMYNGMTDDELDYVKTGLSETLVPVREQYATTR